MRKSVKDKSEMKIKINKSINSRTFFSIIEFSFLHNMVSSKFFISHGPFILKVAFLHTYLFSFIKFS